jgi:hypothetical protein
LEPKTRGNEIMGSNDLEATVQVYEDVVSASRKIARNVLSSALCQIFLTRSARAVLSCFNEASEAKLEIPSEKDSETKSQFELFRIPTPANASEVASKLLAAINKRDREMATSLLEEIGVLQFCSTHDRQLSRLEMATSSVLSRAQMIPLVELALFAVEQGDYASARKFAVECHGFRPGPSEMHDLQTVEGMIAFNEGDLDKAIKCLKNSILVCMTDEYACLSCSVRAPNTMLAKKLVENGDKDGVIEYLVSCQDVWGVHKALLAEWIGNIRNGERPEFLASGLLAAVNHPAMKLLHLSTKASFVSDDAPGLSEPKSRAEVIAGMERLRAEYKRSTKAAIKGALGNSNN